MERLPWSGLFGLLKVKMEVLDFVFTEIVQGSLPGSGLEHVHAQPPSLQTST